MFNRFVADSRVLTARAAELAVAAGDPSVEAEHLLVALAERRGTPAGDALHEAGLDPERIREGLEEDARAALAAVGVEVPPGALGARSVAPSQTPWGATGTLALERSLEAARDRRDREIRPEHVLLGILRTRVGAVPRLLEREGVDRDALAAAV
ncbi:MAG: Clp protease N-terminal domain-containing protein [Actinomycetota bacterium]|nr:Clp protease N-terminal domain-containing protein [Actinomycetota bacterium]